MKPGRVLDILIAEKVFGHKVVKYDFYGTEDYIIKEAPLEYLPAYKLIVPYYSTDIAEAWKIIEKFGGKVEISQEEHKYRAFISDYIAVSKTSSPHAICLVVLSYLSNNTP